jgi:hypothetical protein
MRKHAMSPALAGLFLLSALLFAMPAYAGDGKTDLIGHFENGGAVAEIDTYTDGAVVVAVMAIKISNRTMTFAFDRNDWPALERLWSAARSTGGEKLVSVGSLAEVGTTEKCVITFAAGPQIRLTIVSPIDGALVFDVPRTMGDDFDAKLRAAATVTTAS